MSREDNIQILQNTEKMCKENIRLQNAIRKSIKHQKLILENDIIQERDKKTYTEPAQVIVSKKRSFEAASAYKNQKVCVHNFASATNPGGGVTRGSNAQEECLCRCSDLYFCLNIQEMWNGFYKPHRNAKNPIHEKRLKRILDVAASRENEVVILGAFGCGAFSNSPEVVAQAARNVIEEYKYTFKTIEFAVYCNPRDERNYHSFQHYLNR